MNETVNPFLGGMGPDSMVVKLASIKIFVISGIAGLVLGSMVAAWAAWQSPIRSAAPVASGGVVEVVLTNSTGTELADIYPEGSHVAHFVVTNNSNVDLSGIYPGGTMTLQSGGNGSSLADLKSNTNVAVAVCTNNYNYNSGNPTCTTWTTVGTYTLTALLDNTPQSAPPVTLTSQGVTTGVRYTFAYGANMPASVQGATFQGVWQFVAVQRAGVRD